MRTPFFIGISVLLTIVSMTAAEAKPSMVVGSKRFTESYILGDIITQVAGRAGEADVKHTQGLGNTGIVFAALKSGGIDLYPEYTGTIALELLKDKTTGDLAALNGELRQFGLGVAVPLGFNDTYALAMRDDQAAQLNIHTISDLAKHPELTVGVSHEFLKRADGWPGVAAAYHLPFNPRGLDHGLAYEAIAAKQIDVTDIYSTDAKIEKYKLRVLKDDKDFFPPYEAVLLYRLDLPKRLPKTWAALGVLKGRISAERMVQMNAQAELHGQPSPAIAADFITHDLKMAGAQNAGMADGEGFWALLFGPDFWPLTWQHLRLVFISLAFGILVGLPLGILATRKPGSAQPILSVVGLIQTIPSLALLAFLIPVLHQIGTIPALVALFLYSLLPIVRNTYTGLLEIAPALRESAVALGLPPAARLRLIELPLASRSILAGIKTSAVINVGTATIAAFIGAGGYGERIASGLALNSNAVLLAGAIPAAALALLVQWGFDLLDLRLVPAGLRAKSGR